MNAVELLNTKTAATALTTSSLSKTKQIQILHDKGLSVAEANTAVSTASLASTQKIATKSTLGLSTAFKGLAASLGITTTALGMIAGGIAVVGAAAFAYRAYAKSQEELALSTKEAAQTLDSQSQSINEYAARYETLHSALLKAKGNEEATYSIKKELLALQTELNEKFGDEYGKLNLVSDAYKNQTNAIRNYNKELANNWLNENVEGVEQATSKMTAKRNYTLSYNGNSSETARGKALKEIASKYEDDGIDLFDDLGNGDYTLFSVHLYADPQSAYETISSFMTDLKNKAKDLGDEHMFDDIIKLSSAELNRSKSIIDEFGEQYSTALLSQIIVDDSLSIQFQNAVNAVDEYNNALLKSENPYDDANVKSAYDNLQKIKSGIQNNTDEWRKYSSVTDKAFAEASTGSYEFYHNMNKNSKELMNSLTGLTDTDLYAMSDSEQANAFNKLVESASEYELTTNDIIDLLVQLGIVQRQISENGFPDTAPSISDTITKLEQFSPVFDTLKSAYHDIFQLEDGKEIFSPANVNLSTFTSLKSILDSMSNDLMLDVDYSAYEDFVKILTNSASTTSDAKNGFNAFVQSIINSSTALGTINEETYAVAESLLKQLGILNAEEVIISAIGYSYEEYAAAKEECAQAGVDLSQKTESEIASFVRQQLEADKCGQALARFQLKKLLANSTTINTMADIENLIQLAKAANIAGIQIESLSNIQSLVSLRDSLTPEGSTDPFGVGKFGASLIDMQIRNKFNDAKNQILDVENATVDFSNIGGGKTSAGSSGKDSAEAYVDAFDEELSRLDNLKSYGKITEKQYLDALRRLYVKYYGQKKQYLEQYEKYEHQYLSGMKSLYESAFSYITKQIDKRISEVENQRDTEIKGLEAQKKAAEDAYQAQIDAVDEQIKGIEKQIDAKNEEIDAINEAAEARKRELDLQKAQYDLERMQNQKTNYVMTDSGFQYQADTSGIRDARESVEDAKREIEIGKIEETINGLEQQKVILEEQRAALELALEASNAYWDAQIENTNQYYDTLIGNLEAYKSRWEELANLEETAKMQATLAELGIAEQDILNMSEEAFLRVKDSYLAILADMYNGNEQMKGQLAELSALTASTGFDTSGLAASSEEAASAIGKIQESTGGAAESIAPLTTELDKLKILLSDVTALFDSLQFPEIGDEDYAQKLGEIAQGFDLIIAKCTELNQNDFSKIIGSGGSSASVGTAAASAAPGIDQGIDAPETSGGGGGFLGLSSAISEAVRSITFQMTLLGLALTIGNMAFAAQIAMINKQYIPAWENLQKRLAEIIGIGGGSENSKNPSSPSTRSVSNTGESADAPSGGGTSIIETLQIGGEEVSKKLENPWLSSFTDFATGDNSVQSICEKIKQLVAEMAAAIKEQCESAAKALSDLSAQYFSNPALNDQSTAKESAKNALEAAGNAINKAAARSASVYTPLAQSNPDNYNMLMRFSAQPAPIEAVPLVMSGFSHEMKDAINHVSNATNLSAVNKAVSINIGDIKVEGVSDAGGLAQAIKERLPNMLLQELKKG